MTADEKRTAAVPVGRQPAPVQQPIAILNKQPEPIERWTQLKAEQGAITCPSIDELMKLVGLRAVQEQVLD
eukprot:COSAG06_NODE_52520_length_305_cov_0.747573_1_plen_70_part_10